MKTKIKIAVFAVTVAAVAGLWYCIDYNGKRLVSTETSKPQVNLPVQEAAQAPDARARYICSGGKSIEASFYNGNDISVESGQPPVPTGKAKITFEDGKNLDLAQTISADGRRYANKGESFILWDKGGSILVLENGVEANYVNCIDASEKIGIEKSKDEVAASNNFKNNDECQGLPIPEIEGLVYHKARIEIIKLGWQPLQTNSNKSDLFGQAATFFDAGYKEVEDCAGTGLGYCRFLFKDDCSNILKVVSAGEEVPELNAYAVVDNTSIMSKKEKTNLGL